MEISAERLGVAEHTFQEHSERHAADQVALRIVFSMQAKFGRWFCNTAFFFSNAVQNSSLEKWRQTNAIGNNQE